MSAYISTSAVVVSVHRWDPGSILGISFFFFPSTFLPSPGMRSFPSRSQFFSYHAFLFFPSFFPLLHFFFSPPFFFPPLISSSSNFFLPFSPAFPPSFFLLFFFHSLLCFFTSCLLFFFPFLLLFFLSFLPLFYSHDFFLLSSSSLFLVLALKFLSYFKSLPRGLL